MHHKCANFFSLGAERRHNRLLEGASHDELPGHVALTFWLAPPRDSGLHKRAAEPEFEFQNALQRHNCAERRQFQRAWIPLQLD